MSPFKNKVVIITGASSGIGKALALQMADDGVQLILAGRRMDELIAVKIHCETKGAKCITLFIDMAEPDTIATFAIAVSRMFNCVDILINNAGISQRSQAELTGIEVDRRIMEVNFFGQVNLTKLLWPMLLNATHTNIVLISSVVGTFGFPQRSAYAASKHALEGFFESWSLENQHKNIHFTTISPGRIFTNISYAALKADGNPHQQLDDGQANGISSETCARKIISGIISNKRKVYVVQQELLLIILRKCFPYLFFKLVKKLKLS
ncbi:MAG: SDR family oxidoreductase [Bacteroidia bacterium]|nr:SDR family oxidoreductase [Bacteroidia bacterium]